MGRWLICVVWAVGCTDREKSEETGAEPPAGLAPAPATGVWTGPCAATVDATEVRFESELVLVEEVDGAVHGTWSFDQFQGSDFLARGGGVLDGARSGDAVDLGVTRLLHTTTTPDPNDPNPPLIRFVLSLDEDALLGDLEFAYGAVVSSRFSCRLER